MTPGVGRSDIPELREFLDKLPKKPCPSKLPEEYCKMCRRLNSEVAKYCETKILPPKPPEEPLELRIEPEEEEEELLEPRQTGRTSPILERPKFREGETSLEFATSEKSIEELRRSLPRFIPVQKGPRAFKPLEEPGEEEFETFALEKPSIFRSPQSLTEAEEEMFFTLAAEEGAVEVVPLEIGSEATIASETIYDDTDGVVEIVEISDESGAMEFEEEPAFFQFIEDEDEGEIVEAEIVEAEVVEEGDISPELSIGDGFEETEKSIEALADEISGLTEGLEADEEKFAFKTEPGLEEEAPPAAEILGPVEEVQVEAPVAEFIGPVKGIQDVTPPVAEQVEPSEDILDEIPPTAEPVEPSEGALDEVPPAAESIESTEEIYDEAPPVAEPVEPAEEFQDEVPPAAEPVSPPPTIQPLPTAAPVEPPKKKKSKFKLKLKKKKKGKKLKEPEPAEIAPVPYAEPSEPEPADFAKEPEQDTIPTPQEEQLPEEDLGFKMEADTEFKPAGITTLEDQEEEPLSELPEEVAIAPEEEITPEKETSDLFMCPSCGAFISSTATVCPTCGFDFEAEEGAEEPSQEPTIEDIDLLPEEEIEPQEEIQPQEEVPTEESYEEEAELRLEEEIQQIVETFTEEPPLEETEPEPPEEVLESEMEPELAEEVQPQQEIFTEEQLVEETELQPDEELKPQEEALEFEMEPEPIEEIPTEEPFESEMEPEPTEEIQPQEELPAEEPSVEEEAELKHDEELMPEGEAFEFEMEPEPGEELKPSEEPSEEDVKKPKTKKIKLKKKKKMKMKKLKKK
ncbi:MAG: hypothetical protein JSW00_19590 [Thermoplasmata archaeon]|nr:MAG: hypothetical protein JSW00_19590 [Thermoplasmata archaeon]